MWWDCLSWQNDLWEVKCIALLVQWINKWISICYTFLVYFFRTGLTARIMFSFEPYSVRKKQNKSINLVCSSKAVTVLPQWQPTTVRACFHLIHASAIPSLLVIFNLPSLGLIWARWSLPWSMCLGRSCTPGWPLSLVEWGLSEGIRVTHLRRMR